MSATVGGPTAPSGHLLGVLMGRSAPWALAAAVGCVVVFGVSGDRADLLGALLGATIVAAFYGADLVALRVARYLAPSATMAVFLGEYLVKVPLFAALLWALNDSSTVDLHATAVTVVVTTVTWVVALTTAALRTRSFALDPGGSPVPDRGKDDSETT